MYKEEGNQLLTGLSYCLVVVEIQSGHAVWSQASENNKEILSSIKKGYINHYLDKSGYKLYLRVKDNMFEDSLNKDAINNFLNILSEG